MKTAEPPSRVYINEEFEQLLAEQVRHAVDRRRPYAVLICIPQHLPGEDVTDVADVAAHCVREYVRADDLTGRLNGEIIAVGLPETEASGARVFAQRLQSDLSLRSNRLRSTSWEAGIATLPHDGTTADELLGVAVTSARTRRRRLGML